MSTLELNDVSVALGNSRRPLIALDDVSLHVGSGRVMGIVGESGSGKSTLGRAIAGLIPLHSGTVSIDGKIVSKQRRSARPVDHVQMVFQDPVGSLDPRMTIGDSVIEGVAAAGVRGRAAQREEALRVLDLVSLDASYASVRPGKLSGGQRQRVALARALAARPRVLIADEVTSALDVSVRGSVLNALGTAVRQDSLTTLFISHDLAVVSALCDDIAVIYAGKVVEVGPSAQVIHDPQHPYTQALLSAVPSTGKEGAVARHRMEILDGTPPDLRDHVEGCRFRSRCPIGPGVHPERRDCVDLTPELRPADEAHRAACHYAGLPTEPASEAQTAISKTPGEPLR